MPEKLDVIVEELKRLYEQRGHRNITSRFLLADYPGLWNMIRRSRSRFKYLKKKAGIPTRKSWGRDRVRQTLKAYIELCLVEQRPFSAKQFFSEHQYVSMRIYVHNDYVSLDQAIEDCGFSPEKLKYGPERRWDRLKIIKQLDYIYSTVDWLTSWVVSERNNRLYQAMDQNQGNFNGFTDTFRAMMDWRRYIERFGREQGQYKFIISEAERRGSLATLDHGELSWLYSKGYRIVKTEDDISVVKEKADKDHLHQVLADN